MRKLTINKKKKIGKEKDDTLPLASVGKPTVRFVDPNLKDTNPKSSHFF